MSSSSDFFKIMKWASPRHSKIPPPLLHEGRFVSSQAERAKILLGSLLARFQAPDDIPACTTSGETRIPWLEELTEAEIRKCTIGCGNTSSGADGISTGLISVCWDSIGPLITHIFRACLRLAHHTSCFKLAEVIFLPKKRRDLCKVEG